MSHPVSGVVQGLTHDLGVNADMRSAFPAFQADAALLQTSPASQPATIPVHAQAFDEAGS